MTKTKLYYAATFLSGLLLGWLAIGWWLWPVAYVGVAYTYELNQADKLAYTSAVVDSFALTGQANPNWFSGWYTDEVQQALEQVAQANPAKANWARALANQASVSILHPVQAKAQNQAKDAIGLDWALPVSGVIGFAILAGCGAFLVFHKRPKAGPNPPENFTQPKRYSELNTIDYVPTQVISSRTLAHARLDFGPDKPTDQHFPIESQQEGEPSLGEFGVNQVEDFMAWDVWLFDQKALVTVTKVLADKSSEEISSRGEVVGWTGPIVLETPNLKMVGSVENSFVDELHHSNGIFTIELVVEAKDAE